MKNSNPDILFASDVKELGYALEQELAETAIRVVHAEESTNILQQLDGNEFGVVVVGYGSTVDQILSVIGKIKEQDLLTEVIVVIDRTDVASAVTLMKAGAADILVDPVNNTKLLQSISVATARFEAAITQRRAEEKNRALTGFEEIIGESPSIQLIRQTINSVAPSDANVFISGESGTGKGLIAKVLHAKSKRASKPFVVLNCATLPKDILEEELFGHEKGYLLRSPNQKRGSLESADGGTIFLDEVAEIPGDLQVRLLHALESGSFVRNGGTDEISFDVRIIAATSRETSAALDLTILRADLFYRLSVVEIELQALRNRRTDILNLANHFLRLFCTKYDKQITGYAGDYVEMLQSYHWPGNVQELRNAVERAVVICPGQVISVLDLPEKILKTQRELIHISLPLGSSVEEAEKKLILETLASVGNNKAQAARILGVSRKTLHNKLHSFDWRLEGK